MKANWNLRKLDQPSKFQKYSLFTTSTTGTNVTLLSGIYDAS